MGRSPPFLVIALLIVISILAFNYWSISDRYEVLEEQLAEIQDHLRLMTIKKENAEKQVEAFDAKLKDSEDLMRKTKTLVEQKEIEMKDLVWQLDSKKESASKLEDKIADINSLVEKQKTSLKELQDKENKMESLKEKNSALSVKNEQFSIQVRELQRELSAAKRQFHIPSLKLPPGSKTGANETTRGNGSVNNEISNKISARESRKSYNADETNRDLKKVNSVINVRNETKEDEENDESLGPAEILDETSPFNNESTVIDSAMVTHKIKEPNSFDSTPTNSQVQYVLNKNSSVQVISNNIAQQN